MSGALLAFAHGDPLPSLFAVASAEVGSDSGERHASAAQAQGFGISGAVFDLKGRHSLTLAQEVAR